MKKIYPLKSAVITGLIIGVCAALAFAVVDGMNQHKGWGTNPGIIRGVIGLVIMVILGIGIYWGMASVKRANNGKLSYGQAFISGLFTGITTAIITVICGLIYTKIVNPEYSDYMVQQGLKAIQAQGNVTVTQLAIAKANLQREYSTAGQAMQALIAQPVIAAIISAFVAIFTRTKK